MNVTTTIKNFLSPIIALIMLLAITGCTPSEPQAITIKIATVVSGEDSPTVQALKMLKKNIESKSEGKIEVVLYLGGQLGKEGDNIEQCRTGDVQMTTINPLSISSTVNALVALEQYFLFDDEAHALRFFETAGGDIILDSFQQMNLQGVSVYPLGFRNLTNNIKPVKELGDLKGLKIRGYNPTQIAAWEAVGCNLSSIDWNELFTSLQQNLIDGQEGALTSFSESKFYEVQKYVTMTRHIFSADILVANMDWLNGLDPETKKFIMAELAIVEDFQQEEMLRQTKDLIVSLTADYGTQFTELNDTTKAEMTKIMGDVTKQSIIAICGQELFDKIMISVEESREE